jgi:hypothetical protein
MRRALPIGLVLLATTAVAFAKPKIVITPIQGDTGNQVREAIATAVADDVRVISRATTVDMMDRLGMSGELVPFDCEKLKAKLGADALVQGTISKLDGRTTLRLSVTAEATSKLKLGYTNPRSSAFRERVRAALGKKLGFEAGAAPTTDDDEDAEPAAAADDKPRRQKKARVVEDDEDEQPKKKPKSKKLADADADDGEDGDKPEKPQKKAKKKRLSDADDADDEDADAGKPKRTKKKRVATDEDDAGDADADAGERDTGDDIDKPRTKRPSALAAVRVDGGGGYGARQLTYKARGDMVPPRVGTAATSGRIAGEIYPLAFSQPKSKLAGLGIVGELDKSFGLAIQIPELNEQAPIDQAHYAIGGQYRFAAGPAVLAAGVRYAIRKYVADRSGLAAPTDLDMPDVKYKAVAPTVSARFPITSRIAMFGAADGLLILTTGAIQKPSNFGQAKVFGIEAAAGTDVTISRTLAVRVAGEFSQINFTFTGDGSMAMARGVKGAIDRSFGVVATLAVSY